MRAPKQTSPSGDRPKLALRERVFPKEKSLHSLFSKVDDHCGFRIDFEKEFPFFASPLDRPADRVSTKATATPNRPRLISVIPPVLPRFQSNNESSRAVRITVRACVRRQPGGQVRAGGERFSSEERQLRRCTQTGLRSSGIL